MDKLERLVKDIAPDITEKNWELCKEGYLIMCNSGDGQHNDYHVRRLLSFAKDLIEAEGLQDKADLEAVVISIIWHDVWKAGQPFDAGVISYVWEQINDGKGSGKVFKKHLGWRNIKTNPTYLKAYDAIDRHARIEYWLPRFMRKLLFKYSPELKIVRDVDGLDCWSKGSWDVSIGLYQERVKEYPQYRWMWKLYYRLILRTMHEGQFYYDWSKKKFRKLYDAGLKRADSYMNSI